MQRITTPIKFKQFEIKNTNMMNVADTDLFILFIFY